MVRRAVSSRPPERPWRGGGANWVGPEDHPEPADQGPARELLPGFGEQMWSSHARFKTLSHTRRRREIHVDTRIHLSATPPFPKFVNMESGDVKCMSRNPHYPLR